MGIKFTNNASTTIGGSITDSGTSISVASGTGSSFPALAGGDYFYATLINSSNELEIVKVTARSTDTMTVVRAQDNTVARAYAAGSRFELRVTAGSINDVLTAVDALETGKVAKAGDTMTGNLTFSGTGRRISADFSNATLTNRASLQSSTTNGNTSIAALPNGSSVEANFVAFNNATPTNASLVQVRVDGTSADLVSGRAGSGTFLPLWFYTNGAKNMELTTAGSLIVAGDITSNSDERLKSDIRTIDGALEKVKQLRGTAYVKDGKDSIGVIAQEVEKVFPEVVLDGSDGFKSVAYGNLVGVLIEAVKELSARVEQLEGSK